MLVVSPPLSAEQFPANEGAAKKLQEQAQEGTLANRAEHMETPVGGVSGAHLSNSLPVPGAPEVSITSKSSVRVALLRVTKFGEDPAVARVLVMKKVKNQAGELVWTEAKEYTVKEGEAIGKKDEKVSAG